MYTKYLLENEKSNIVKPDFTISYLHNEIEVARDLLIKLHYESKYLRDNNNFQVSQEVFLDSIKKLIQKVFEIIEKMKSWINNNIQSIQLKFLAYRRQLDSMSKSFRNIRDKNTIVITKDTYYKYSVLFNTMDLNKLDEGLKESVEQIDNLDHTINKILHNESIDGFICYNLAGEVRTVNSKGPLANSIEYGVHKNHRPDENQEPMLIPYNDFFIVIEDYDLEVRNIHINLKTINNAVDRIKKEMNILNNKKILTSDDINIIRNLSALQFKGIPNILEWYLKSIKYMDKILRLVLEDNLHNSIASYQYFIDQCQTNKSFFTANPDLAKQLGDPNNFKLVNNNPYIYIDFKIPDNSTIGPGVSYIGARFKDLSNIVDYSGRDAFKKEAGFDFYKMGLIFLDSDYIRRNSKYLNFKVCYWHEVGHIVTRQNESTYEVRFTDAKDSWFNIVERYIRHETENQADAFALIKTNISIEALWESRVKALFDIVVNQKKTSTNKNPSDVELKEWLEELNNRKEEYIRNVKAQIDGIRQYVKLDILSLFRSYVK